VTEHGTNGSSLAGRVVLVTRPPEQSAELERMLASRGARALVAPTIEIAPARSSALARAAADLSAGRYEWVALTSASTVDALARRIGPGQVRARVAVIGDGTARAFRAWARREPDLVPAAFTTEALARSFPRGHGRVLCPRADVAPPGLEDSLARKGWTPQRVDAYRTRLARALPADARAELRAGRVDAVTFTSASTVRGFARAAGRMLERPGGIAPARVVCIGPVTAAEARAHGLRVAAVARPHTVEGLVAALERALAPSGRRRATHAADGDGDAARTGRRSRGRA
jgi:uroporphyrinogen-III synthase